MTKGKEAEEEEETENKDAEEPFMEEIKYYEFIKLLSKAQLLKTIMNVEVC